jgi:hypothetical protein
MVPVATNSFDLEPARVDKVSTGTKVLPSETVEEVLAHSPLIHSTVNILDHLPGYSPKRVKKSIDTLAKSVVKSPTSLANQPTSRSK